MVAKACPTPWAVSLGGIGSDRMAMDRNYIFSKNYIVSVPFLSTLFQPSLWLLLAPGTHFMAPRTSNDGYPVAQASGKNPSARSFPRSGVLPVLGERQPYPIGRVLRGDLDQARAGVRVIRFSGMSK